jgi:hypothetical protein
MREIGGRGKKCRNKKQTKLKGREILGNTVKRDG